MKQWAVIAPEGYELELERELAWRGLKPLQRQGRVYVFEGKLEEIFWSQVIWKEVERISFSSISDGAKQLRGKAKKFVHFSNGLHRRGELILEQLRSHKEEVFPFPGLIAEASSGAFTLLSANEALVCASFDRPHPLGEVKFLENKSAPSRAYLKLWEGLALTGKFPGKNDLCLDLGSSPGGWTWVLASLGAQVLSVDRSALAPEVAQMPGVKFQSGDAFQIKPEKVGRVNWLFSDVICFPEKLWEFLQEWREANAADYYLCTLKFQGDADPEVIAKFAQHGKIMHLYHNKHELTWISGFEQIKL